MSDLEAIAGKRNGFMRQREFAERLGVHPRTIKRAYLRGALPGSIQHGPRILMIPTHLYRLSIAYGLHGVERMAKAGLI